MFYINNSIKTDVRYDPIKFMNFDVDNIDPLNSFILLNVPRLPQQGVITLTVPEQRPDMISYRIYKNTQYWWLIMWYNSILSIQELKTGMQIKYFNLGQLEQLYIHASTCQKVL